MTPTQHYRYSGHGSYPCRYTWIIKTAEALRESPFYFRDEAEATLGLGVGKSMIRPMLFWTEAAKVIEPWGRREYTITKFGDMFLAFDPYLESEQSLWLLHWNFSTNQRPLLAWDFLLNHWHQEIRPHHAITELIEQVSDREPVYRTIAQHFNVFLHTYVQTPRTARDTPEDLLLHPFHELKLLRNVGESADGKEQIYNFNREPKPVSPQLFLYCLHDYWQRHFPNQKSLSFKEICWEHCSPGRTFMMGEDEMAGRLEGLQALTHGAYHYEVSPNLKQVHRRYELEAGALLESVYLADVWHQP